METHQSLESFLQEVFGTRKDPFYQPLSVVGWLVSVLATLSSSSLVIYVKVYLLYDYVLLAVYQLVCSYTIYPSLTSIYFDESNKNPGGFSQWKTAINIIIYYGSRESRRKILPLFGDRSSKVKRASQALPGTVPYLINTVLVCSKEHSYLAIDPKNDTCCM